MRFLTLLVLGLGALCVDLFVREAWGLDAFSPNLLVVVLLWLGTCRDWTEGALTAAVLGFLNDAFAGSPPGLYLLHAILLFYLSRAIAGRVRFQGLLGRLPLGIAGALASLFILVLIGRVFLGDTAFPDRIVELLLPRLVGVLLGVPLLFPILDRLDTLLVRRPDTDLL
jgi:rod shape-determining protein MreD